MKQTKMKQTDTFLFIYSNGFQNMQLLINNIRYCDYNNMNINAISKKEHRILN